MNHEERTPTRELWQELARVAQTDGSKTYDQMVEALALAMLEIANLEFPDIERTERDEVLYFFNLALDVLDSYIPAGIRYGYTSDTEEPAPDEMPEEYEDAVYMLSTGMSLAETMKYSSSGLRPSWIREFARRVKDREAEAKAYTPQALKREEAKKLVESGEAPRLSTDEIVRRAINRRSPFESGMIAGPFDVAAALVGYPVTRRSGRALAKLLVHQAGWTELKNLNSAEKQTKKTVIAHPEIMAQLLTRKLTKSKIRNLFD